MPANIIFGHNKFHKLKELLEHHFNSNNGNNQKDTRAIVFVEVCILAFQKILFICNMLFYFKLLEIIKSMINLKSLIC